MYYFQPQPPSPQLGTAVDLLVATLVHHPQVFQSITPTLFYWNHVMYVQDVHRAEYSITVCASPLLAREKFALSRIKKGTVCKVGRIPSFEVLLVLK